MSRLARNHLVHGRQISTEEVEAAFDAVDAQRSTRSRASCSARRSAACASSARPTCAACDCREPPRRERRPQSRTSFVAVAAELRHRRRSRSARTRRAYAGVTTGRIATAISLFSLLVVTASRLATLVHGAGARRAWPTAPANAAVAAHLSAVTPARAARLRPADADHRRRRHRSGSCVGGLLLPMFLAAVRARHRARSSGSARSRRRCSRLLDPRVSAGADPRSCACRRWRGSPICRSRRSRAS